MSLVSSPWLAALRELDAAGLARLRVQAESTGVIARDWIYLVSPLGFEPGPFAELVADLRVLERLIFALPERLFGGSERALCALFGIETRIAELLAALPPALMSTPIRWDLMPTSAGWQVLELNGGACLGGLNGFALVDSYADLTAEHCAVLASAIPDALRIYGRAIARRLGTEGQVVDVVETERGFQAYRFFLDSFTQGIASGGQLAARAQDIAALPSDCRNLLPMFTIDELIPERPAHAALIDALLDGKIRSLVPFSEHVYSSKGVLAVLSDPRSWDRFSPGEIDVIRRRIPRTALLTSPACEEIAAGAHVLKPCQGYGGAGVLCSWQQGAESLDAIRRSGRPYVVQERVVGESVPAVVVDRDGRSTFGVGRPVLGLITLEGDPVGGLSRLILNEDTPGVVNAHQGAALGLTAIPWGKERAC